MFSRSLYLFLFVFFGTALGAQSVNFDETWKEFLLNNKISNMSELNRPDKVADRLDYAKYLLMNTNSGFCQSEIEKAETLMEEIGTLNPEMLKAIPGYVKKKEELQAKIDAYYSMDKIWIQFLKTREVSLEALESIKAAKTSCEKQTLAKYSYMTAHYHLCEGEVMKSKNIFENRTLRLAEKTSLRVQDVEGLASEVRRMKTLYQNLSKLDVAWRSYLDSGVSPGFDAELPLFPCYPIPNMKELVLKGMLNVCNGGQRMLDQIRKLQADSGVVPDGDLAEKVKVLETAIKKKDRQLAVLDKAWADFIPDNKVRYMGKYGYSYCEKEPLIRAWIMDGFAYVCELAEESLERIDSLQNADMIDLEPITMTKITELSNLYQEYQINAMDIEGVWSRFVSQGDTLYKTYQSTQHYCDNIHQVKDWVMKGLTSSCEEGIQYLEQIEKFQETFEFNFYEDLECRVQKLRTRVWDCRYLALREMASIEVSEDSSEERLEKLMQEYGMPERPEDCVPEE
ncbi:MAG: hypothetical protein AAFO94_02150 [Bacteroidota bacterium]